MKMVFILQFFSQVEVKFKHNVLFYSVMTCRYFLHFCSLTQLMHLIYRKDDIIFFSSSDVSGRR